MGKRLDCMKSGFGENMRIALDNITGLILAGGRGSRMGNVDKGLQLFCGVPLVTHVIERLAPQVGSLALNANRNVETYESFCLPVWMDRLDGFEGPLAGIQAGLEQCNTDYLVTAPCDSPFLPDNLVPRLGDALVENGADVAVAFTGAGEEKQLHPVFCMMKTSVLPHLSAYLQSGGRKAHAWYRGLKVAEAPFADEMAFCNINTLEELRRLENI